MSAHTPTPWEIGASKQSVVYCKGQESKVIAVMRSVDYLINPRFQEGEAEANAARIVQCVNEHDGLIEQIASLRAERDGLVAKCKEQAELIERMESEVVRCQVSETDKVFEINELVEALFDAVETAEYYSEKTEKTLAKYEK